MPPARHVTGLIAALIAAGCSSGDRPPATPPPAAVDAITVQAQALPLDLTYTAQTRGVREVEVRARVSGILLQRQYEEGSQVKAGDLLFRIDPAQARTVVQQARAHLGVAEAEMADAKRDADRAGYLHETGLLSLRDRDAALAMYESKRASTAASRAALDAANLNLSYTEVRAPIDGLTSREARSEGSLVTAGDESSLLTRIVQTDRLYVEFAVPESEAVLIRTAMRQHELPVDVILDDGGEEARTATLTFIDTAADLGSGTVHARAVLDNQAGDLIPGQFVRAVVRGVSLPSAAIVPSRAVMRGVEGPYVWTVDENSQAAFRPVRTGRAQGNLVVIVDGLAPGDRAIVDGVAKVQPGMPVAPNIVTLEQAVAERRSGPSLEASAETPPGSSTSTSPGPG